MNTSSSTAAGVAATEATAMSTASGTVEGDPSASTASIVYLPPSSVHYIDLSTITNGKTSFSVDEQQNAELKFSEAAPGKVGQGSRRKQKTLKIQAVKVGDRWFSLSSTQLDLCRRMERDGTCQRVKIIETPVSELSTDRRSKLQTTLKALNIDYHQLQSANADLAVPEGTRAADNVLSRTAEEQDPERDGHVSSSVDSGDSSSECDWSEECRSSQDSDTTADLDAERDVEQQQQL